MLIIQMLFATLIALIFSSQYTACLETIKKLNDLVTIVNSGQGTWKAGENFGPSLSEKYIHKLLGSTLDEKYVKRSERTYFDRNPIPIEFDARYHWRHCPSIGHIRDQGYCRSSWAVAAATTLTDRYCIATNGKFKQHLSVEDLLSCCYDCGHGCDGGSSWFAWNHFWREGITTGGDHGTKEGCKPYSLKSCDHTKKGSRPQCDSFGDVPTPRCHYDCLNDGYKRGFWSDHHRVLDFYLLSNETEKIQHEIMEHGPVEASMMVYEDFLVYKTGVYIHLTGASQGGHAVKIIGWGLENRIPYWLVVNSWNSDWGDNGTFKILQGQNHCNIENYIIAGTPDTGYL